MGTASLRSAAFGSIRRSDAALRGAPLCSSQVDICDATDELRKVKLCIQEDLSFMEEVLVYDGISITWRNTMHRHSDCISPAMLRLGVLSGAKQDAVRDMMLSSFKVG